MPTYDWLCHVCKTSNPAGAEMCKACGLPAIAEGADIDAAVTGRERNVVLRRKELKELRRKEIAALPLWKKPFAYILLGLQLVGSVIFAVNLFGLAWDGIAAGLATVLVSEILYQLLIRGIHVRQSE